MQAKDPWGSGTHILHSAPYYHRRVSNDDRFPIGSLFVLAKLLLAVAAKLFLATSAKKAWMALLALHQSYLLFLDKCYKSRIIYIIDREIVSRPDK